MSKNGIRTFSISEAVIKKLNILHDCYCMDRATFIKMAIYHGIEKIRNGYCPYRNHNLKKLAKSKYKITLPEETWQEFKGVMESIRYKIEEHIPDGEMIEMFIRMEIKGYVAFTKKYLENDEVDDLELFNTYEEVSITTTIPKIFWNKFQNETNATGLTKGRLIKYLVIRALFHECCQTDFETIDSDADLLQLIDAYDMNRIKTLTFLRVLIESNKIIFLNDANMDY